MPKNIQVCARCGQRLTGTCSMQLMMGPKGYRSYAVCSGPCVKKNGKKAARSAKARA